jgi:carboxylate-amine ligase
MTADDYEDFSLGIEEEFIIVDPESRRLRPEADRVLTVAPDDVDDEVQPEFRLSQLETATPACHTLVTARKEVTRLRAELIAAAERVGYRVGATGTHPFSHWEEDRVTPKVAYRAMERDYQQLARERTVCGGHVHVGIADAEARIQVMNRVRPWLPVLLALSVNSPFWLGFDTGYHSFRTIMAHRSPLSGVPEPLASEGQYRRLVDTLIQTGVIDDASRLMWDVRPSARFPTLEFRMSDVCLTLDETVMVAGLARALAEICHGQWTRGEAAPEAHPQVVSVATWRAARYGLEDKLIDVIAARPVPARNLVNQLLLLVRPALAARGEWDEVSGVVDRVVLGGTAAARQRRAFERAGQLEDVVDLVVAETAAQVG